MKLLLAALAALSTLAPTDVLAADSVLPGAFQKLCLDPDGKAATSEALARSIGYVTPPESFKQGLLKFWPQGSDSSVLWTVYDGGVLALIVGHVVAGASTPNGEVCAVAEIPSEPDARGALAALLDIGATPAREGGGHFFLYDRQDNGQRKAIESGRSDDIQRLTKEGRLRLADAEGNDQASVLILYVPDAQ